MSVLTVSGRESLPLRERGLKYVLAVSDFYTIIVAPLAGAWIEILFHLLTPFSVLVAPLAGAWIEIVFRAFLDMPESRRSPCGSVD